MMKALVVLLFVALAFAANCPARVCQTVGNTCLTTTDNFYTCQGGLFCSGDATAAKCQATLPIGGNCTGLKTFSGSTGPCGDGASCVNGTTCVALAALKYGPGFLCRTAADCATGTCDSGRCSGVASGSSCTVDAACAYGLFCQNGTCASTLALGATCTSSRQCNDPRNPNFVYCSTGSSRTCVAEFTVAAGGSCVLTTDCMAGLICAGTAGSSTCIKAQSTASSNKACTPGGTDCVNTEACGCPAGNGGGAYTCQKIIPFTQRYIDSLKAATTCEYASFNCFTQDVQAGTQCENGCYKKICSVVAQVNSQIATNLCDFTSDEKNAFNKCLKASASTFFLAPAVALVAILALFM